MPDSPIPPVPPGSTPLRQVAAAVDQALALPRPASEHDEVTYLRVMRDRAREVRQAMRDILSDRGIEEDGRDVMAVIENLRHRISQLGDDAYDHRPEPS